MEHEPVETQPTIEREQHPTQSGKLAQRVMLGVFLERLKSPRDLDQPRKSLAQAVIRYDARLPTGGFGTDEGRQQVGVLRIPGLSQFIVESSTVPEITNQKPMSCFDRSRRGFSQGTDLDRLGNVTEQSRWIEPRRVQGATGMLYIKPGGNVDGIDLNMCFVHKEVA